MRSPAYKTDICRKIMVECMGYQDTFFTLEQYLRDCLGEDFHSLLLALKDPEIEGFYFLLDSSNSLFDYFRNKRILSNNLVSYALTHFRELHMVENPPGFCKEKNLEPHAFSQPTLFCPIKDNNRIHGVIGCCFNAHSRDEENPFFRFLQNITDIVSFILEKLHQYEIITQSLVEMQAISEIGVRMYKARKLDEVLQEIIDNVVTKLGFDHVLIAIIDDNTRNLKGRISCGYEESLAMIDYSVASSENILAEVARTEKAIIVQDVSKDPRFPRFMRERQDVWQCAVVPLMSLDGRIWGALSADHKKNRGQITSHRLHVLEDFARHATIAIENARLYEHVHHMSQIDGLTKVYNRSYFDSAMEKEIPRVKRYNHPLSLLMIDICDFKDFNDRYGHVVGDQILKDVGCLLLESVRETDIVARYGGDEFVVLMPSTTETQAKMVMERIERAVLLRNNRFDDVRRKFLISMGLKSANARNVDNILSEADKAMYRGKEQQVNKSLLHALVANDALEVERWDKFIANILKILAEKEYHFHNHSRRVMNYSVKICQLLGLDQNFLEIISIAALLHDIGKISINSELLRRAAPLSPKEYEIIKTHTTMGVELLKGAEHLKAIREIIFSHHERWDGKTEGSFPGYPEGKSGKDIPFGARILKIADSYDAMISLRPYSKPLSFNDAIRELLDEQGRSFDPQIIKVFVPYLRNITSSLSTSFQVESHHFL